MKRFGRLLLMIGMLVILFGIGVDYLVPGASPGLNLPQLLIVVAGATLSVFAVRITRSKGRPAQRERSAGKALLKVFLISGLTLLVLEIVLVAWGRPTYFPRQIPMNNVQEIPWGICDELGCRKKYEAVVDACESGYLSGIRCIINRDGFGDSDEFVVQADFPARPRILMLGDSYTRGFYADVGKSFVDSLEAAMPEAVIWNGSEPGTATNQAVLTFAGIAPRLKPQLTILGFYMNDFPENLLPKEMSLRLIDEDGKQYFVRRFEFDRWGRRVELPPEFVNAYLAAGSVPPTSDLERLVGTTHIGTLALRTWDFLLRRDEDESFDSQKNATRKHLAQLTEAAASLESQLLVLLIPRSGDVETPGQSYRGAIELFEELRIPYLEVRSLLDAASDYVDSHWNTAGHQKVGAFLSECVQAYFVTGDLASCEDLVIP